MEEQNDEQTQPANPVRARSKWLRWLAVPAAVAVVALIYQLNRPQELVWWRSGAIGQRGRHVLLKVPDGWEIDVRRSDPSGAKSIGQSFRMTLVPIDKRPAVLQSLFPSEDDNSSYLSVLIVRNPEPKVGQPGAAVNRPRHHLYAAREVADRTAGVYAAVQYECFNAVKFNRTFKQICDSLTIE